MTTYYVTAQAPGAKKARRLFISRDHGKPTMLRRNMRKGGGVFTEAQWTNVKRWAKQRGLRVFRTPVDPYPMVKGKRAGVNHAILARLNAAARDRGTAAIIRSGKRSRAEQMRLWLLFKAGKGAPANYPGTSDHELGEAVDGYWEGGGNFAASDADMKLLAKHRLAAPHRAREPWHLERTERA